MPSDHGTARALGASNLVLSAALLRLAPLPDAVAAIALAVAVATTIYVVAAPADDAAEPASPVRNPLKNRRTVFPDRLMPIAPYVRRAEELDAAGLEKAAFYCRRYAMILAVRISCGDPGGMVEALERSIETDGSEAVAEGRAAVLRAIDAG
eukprot:CAMPEP_0119284206 /NCGR_PEP_ID=MMETSP1329-20130426/29904_1 /TAXON_ID=114041 /ORGANISM="Genus nov. species nov., Strain RCC1024" /LENGTH=151 /DNA_ID=CAMNT_0007284881 /DNA_START=149 /DNA_END=600 /DNA_ORIENTATION=+